MNLLELSQKRFSVRKFTAEQVSEEDLKYILEVTTHGPFGSEQTALEVRCGQVVRGTQAVASLLQT